MRHWINSTGSGKLNLRDQLPHNLTEALKMRKQHEKLELRFLNYLAEYASMKDTCLKDSQIGSLSELDSDITNFIEKLNLKTQFVVSCFTYFRLRSLLDNVENATKGSDLFSLKSVLHAITCLDRGMMSSSLKIALLSHELQRLKIMLEPEDNKYFYQLMDRFREACQLTANAQQIMNLRKLVLFKERRILECEEKIHSTVAFLRDIELEVNSIYASEFVGKTVFESAALVKTYHNFAGIFQATFSRCQHLFDVYHRMCTIDDRQLCKQIVSTKAHLPKHYAKFCKKIEEIIRLTSYSESFYMAADSLLETVRNALLHICTQLPSDNTAVMLEELNNEFQNLRKLGASILDNVECVPEIQITASGKVKTRIQLKLYIVCLKLQEYERKTTGNVSNLFNCHDNFALHWYHSQSPVLAQQSMKIKRSLSQSETLSGHISHHSQSLLSLPSKLAKSRSNTLISDASYGKNMENFVRHLNGLAQTHIIPVNTSTIDDADKTLQSIEAAKILADAEWRKLGSRVGLMDDRNVVAQHYSIWCSQLTGKREGVLQRKRLLLHILELGHDFNACSRKLEQLINAACCPDGAKSSRDYLKKLETINSEVMRLRNTVPAQEEVMEALNNDVKTVFNDETITDLSKVQQVWSNYVQELCKFESILPTLMQNSQLLAAAHGFTNSLQSKFDGIIQDSESLKEVQQEAARLQKDIERHLNSIENSLDPMLKKSSVEGLQSALGTLQEVGEEVEIMTTNLNNCMKPNGSPNSDCSPPLHHHGLYNDHQKYGNSRDSQQSSWELRANTLGYENDASFTEDEMYFTKRSDAMHATPGGSITIHCTFHEFDAEPIVKWSFVPAHHPSDEGEFAESFLASTTIPRNDAKNASLLIPNVLYKHAGQYIVTITHPLTDKQITSSSTLHVRPKLKRGLTDLSAIVDGNKCTVTGKEVAFFLEYGGFDKIPSRVVWLHNGRPIDPTKWTVSISPLTTRIKSDCLKSVDEGQYTCQVIDDELDVKLESSAILRLQNALDVPQPASRVSSQTGTPPGNEKSLWITNALDSSPLLLKCPLPSIAFEAYSGARRVRMQWFRDGIQLYDSDWQTPNYFTGSQGVSFVDGNTFWSVSVCEGRAVLLNTNRVRSVDAGCYSCRVTIDNDAYESSGVITVCSSQQFIQQLTGLKVYLGEPAELRCRLEPWVTGDSPELRTTVNWYHFETILTPELQDRVGIKTECNEGLCTLRIEKTSRRFGGVYKCEARNKFGICVTSCRLLIDLPVPPTVLGPIQCLNDLNEDDAAILRVEYDAVPQPTVIWLKDGQTIKQGTGYKIITAKEESLLHIPNARLEGNGVYAVVIKNVAGSAESSYTLHFDKDSARRLGSHARQSLMSFMNDQRKRDQENAPPSSRLGNPEVHICTNSDGGATVGEVFALYQPVPMPREIRQTPGQFTRSRQGEGTLVKRYRTDSYFSRPAESVSQNETGRSTHRSPMNTSPGVQSQHSDNGKLFLLRPQSISANVGESAIFSCVIRPSPEVPKIYRVSWRHMNRELKQGGDETPRVITRANNPCDGVFQLQFTNICRGDDGDYEVSALDENDAEICSATFRLSVDDRNSYGDGGRESLIRDEVFLDSPRLPSSATVGVGERLEMTCYIPGYPIPQVFWLKDGQQLNDHGSINDFQIRKRGHVYQLIILYALPHHAGLWEVIARNSAGLVISGSRIEVRATERRSSLVLRDRRARSLSPCALTETSQGRANLCLDRPHMHEQAPQFTRLFRDQTASCGDDVRFECTVIGLPMPDIRWEHNGEELQQSTVRSFKISNIDAVHKLVLKTVDSTFSGRYTLIAENPMGVAACSAMLTVRRPISKGAGVVEEEPCLTEVHTLRGSPFTIHVSPREASPVFGDKVSTLDELSSKKIVNTKAQTPSSPGSILHPSTNT
ncbi:titin [Echinococcus multilocularis]|uniref:Titin n=1 Tax=Echinococcus multilocularis TaxID=6211 RepID=A0A068Y7R6_ECHMU|nr:titin [Echinococcus multilocularis]